MTEFDLDYEDEKSRSASEFMSRVTNEIRRAFATEKAASKITQQAVSEKIGTSRAVINRQVQGLENLTIRRVAELLWAIGWSPEFRARKNPKTNYHSLTTPPPVEQVPSANRSFSKSSSSFELQS